MTQTTTVAYESRSELSDPAAAALRHLVLAVADTKLLLGYHYGQWTFGTPVLEAAIANCSLAQSEFGHVRLLHAVLRNQFADDPDALVERRSGSEFASVTYLDHEIADWASMVAANYVVDLAMTRVLYALRGSAFKPLRMSVDKMLDEERYHIHHGQGWFRTLADRGEESRAAVAQAVGTALASVVEWFGPADEPEDRALVETGIKAQSNEAVLAALLRDVAQVGDRVGVSTEADRHAIDAAWTPATRRAAGAGPDEEILVHLRGSKNEIFKLR